MSFLIEGLSYAYRRRGDFALHDVSLVLPSTAVTAILGPSGSGKTTLLNVLGLLAGRGRRDGQVVYQSDKPQRRVDYDRVSRSEANRLRQRHFGFVFQSAYLLPNFTCEYNATLPLRLDGVGSQSRKKRLGALTETLDALLRDLRNRRDDAVDDSADDDRHDAPADDLGEVLGRRPAQVSGGERQRIAVLRSAIHDPEVLFADEPFSNLDPDNTELIEGLLLRWQRGELAAESTAARARALLLVTHNIESALRMANNIVVIRRGQLATDGIIKIEKVPGYPDTSRMTQWLRDLMRDP